MYAVIFKATTNELDEVYFDMARKMRELAINRYECTEFTAVTEGSSEIAISYWENLEQIKKWKQDSEHLIAQELGRSKWYTDYKVQIVQVISEYEK